MKHLFYLPLLLMWTVSLGAHGQDDPTCSSVEYIPGGWPEENSFSITTCDGQILASMASGSEGFSDCIDLGDNAIITLSDSYGDGWNGGTLVVDGQSYTISEGNTEVILSGDCGVLGCVDATACNFNAEATIDDASCTYPASAAFDCEGNCVEGGSVVTYIPGTNPTLETVNIVTCEGAPILQFEGSSQGYADCIDLPANAIVNFSGYSWSGGVLIVDGTEFTLEESGTSQFFIGSCGVLGCTDAEACNYSADATFDDGSCTYAVIGFDCDGNCLAGAATTVEVGGGSWDNEISWNITESDGNMVAEGAAGTSTICLDLTRCYTINMFDSYGDGWNGGTFNIPEAGFSTGLAAGASGSALFGDCEVPCEYEQIAVSVSNADSTDFGFVITDLNGASIAMGGNDFSGSACLDLNGCYSVALSSANGQALGWSNTPALTIGDQTFDWGESTNAYTSEYDYAIGSSCPTPGCMDMAACNYSAEATIEDESCEYPLSEYVDCEGACLNDSDADGVCDESEIPGCTDETACNYDASATDLDDSCDFTSCVGEGCTDASACNYDDSATVEDGSCIFAALGFACDSTCINGSAYDVVVGGGAWLNEVSWTITNASGDVVANGAGGLSQVCLDLSACLTLNMYDSYGDGWNGNTLDVYDGPDTVFSSSLLAGSEGSDNLGTCVIECDATEVAVAVTDADSTDFGFVLTDLEGNSVVMGGNDFNGTACLDLNACYNLSLSSGTGSSQLWSNTPMLTIGDSTYTWVGNGAYSSNLEFAFGSGCFTLGCTDESACNYDASATGDDGTCIYPFNEEVDCEGNCPDGNTVVAYTAGSWPEENSFEITDCDGNVLASMPLNSQGYYACLDIPESYVVHLIDSYGDGWDSATLTIGTEVYSIPSGTGDSFYVGDCSVPGCEDESACNYGEEGACDYNSPSYGAETSFQLGVLLPELGCNGGYAASQSGVVTLVPHPSGSGMTWYVDPFTEEALINSGFEPVLQDLTSQTVIICGDVMHVSSVAFGFDYTITYDGTGFINTFYGGYLAPSINFDTGCNFEFACNYDPCAIADFSQCEFLDVDVTTTPDLGGGEGSALATAAGGAAPYDYAYFEGPNTYGVDAISYDNPVEGLAAGQYSVLAADSTGCIGEAVFNIELSQPCEGTEFEVYAGGGIWDSEISWEILDAEGNEIASGVAGNATVCLDTEACYTLNLADAYGDGWNGASISIGGEEVGTIEDGAAASLTYGNCGSEAACEDPIACNYGEEGACDYNSPSYGAETAFQLGLLLPELGCNGGYAASQSGLVTLVPHPSGSGMTWSIDPYTEAALINNGFEVVLQDLTSQVVVICGDDMSVTSTLWGSDYTLTYDGTGFINSFYGGYLAPSVNFDTGCNFEFACNYDPCAIADFSLCEFLDLDVTTTPSLGGSEGTALATATGGVGPYNYAFVEGSDAYGADPFSYVNPTAGLTAGTYSVFASDSNGCIGDVTFVIEPGICSGDSVEVLAGGGSWDSEISWEILNSDSAVVASGVAGTTGICLDLTDCYTVNLYDAYGDGWNGASISINGQDLGTLETGSAGAVSFGNCDGGGDPDPEPTCDDTELQVIVGGGAWDVEVSFVILDAEGAEVLSGGAGTYTACFDLLSCYTIQMSDSYGDGWNGAGLMIGNSFLTTLFDGATGSQAFGLCASGCTYADAQNYSDTAVIDDGSCEFELAADCPADLDGNGAISTSDLLVFLQDFGTFCD